MRAAQLRRGLEQQARRSGRTERLQRRPGTQTPDADSVVFEYLVQPERGSLMRQQAEQLGSVHREGCVILGGESVSDGQLAPPFLGSSGSLERLNGSTSRFVRIGFVDSGLAVPCG